MRSTSSTSVPALPENASWQAAAKTAVSCQLSCQLSPASCRSAHIVHRPLHGHLRRRPHLPSTGRGIACIQPASSAVQQQHGVVELSQRGPVRGQAGGKR